IEMGGKNAIIVDADADLDEAVDGVLYSAFAFQGQKCSACSRVIVLDDIYDRFIERLVEAARSLPVLPSHQPKAVMGPVVDREAYERIRNTIDKAKSSARLAYCEPAPEGGYFVRPHIFTDV